MFKYQVFDDAFEFDPECSYDEDDASNIVAVRNDGEGLFIDLLLKMLSMKRRKRYNLRDVVWSSTDCRFM